MKISFAALLLLVCTYSFSQTKRQLVKQREKLVENALDSIYLREDYKQLTSKLEAINNKTNSYTAGVLNISVANTNTNAFNSSIAGSGYGGLAQNSLRLGFFGTSYKNKRMVIDFMLLNLDFGSRTKQGNNTIHYQASDFLNTSIGYAIIDTRKLIVYPFVGAALRVAQLQYTTATLANPNATSITNLIINNTSANLNNVGFIYQGGAAIDILLRESKEKRKGVYLHINAAHTGHFGRNIFRNSENDVRFQPNLNYGNFIGTVGLKWFMRN